MVISDCLRLDSFDLTQEDIAVMLGHERNRLTLNAGELKSKVIEYGRGRIRISNRKVLEERLWLSLGIRNRQLPHPIRKTLARHTKKLCRMFAISFTELKCVTNMKFIFPLTPGL